MQSSIPTAITPIYSTKSVNEVIRFYEGPLQVIAEGQLFPGSGFVEQRWLPKPHIFLECRYESRQWLNSLKAQVVLPPDAPRRFDISLTSAGLAIQGEDVYATLAGHPIGLANGSPDALQSLLFHIPNFCWCQPDLVRDEALGKERAGRTVRVSADEWNINIDSVADYSFKEEDQLEKSSGNAITHVGIIQRKDGSTFSVQTGQQILKVLYYWLSFCRGNWVAPILAVGFDQTGKEVWKDWQDWTFRCSERVDTWVNRQNTFSLNQTLPGFYAKFSDEFWKGPISNALSWYVESNRRASGLEASIILCQTALELLGWVSLVEDKKIISQSGFEDLPASDKIRLLLSNNGIPLEVPVFLADSIRLSKAYQWHDGPACLTGIRNALVHPGIKNREKIERISPLAFFEVWSLGLWYLDLAFLKLFNYAGVYRNRLRRECPYDDALEKVPWMP